MSGNHALPASDAVMAARCGDSAFTWMPWPWVSTARLTVQRLSIAFVDPYADPARAVDAHENGGPAGGSPAPRPGLWGAPRPPPPPPGAPRPGAGHAPPP